MEQRLRVYCDFNEGDDASGYFILFYEGAPLAGRIDELGLSEGSPVILYQDEGDFEVGATLKWNRTLLGEEAWVAIPDWETRRDFQ